MPPMPPRTRPRLLSPAMVVALLALVVSLGGTATAAKLISGKQILDNSVTSKDLKNRSIRLGDLSPATRAALTWDPSAALVPGRTITGSTYYVIDASSAAQDLDQTVAFPARAPRPVAHADFSADRFVATTDDAAACRGSYRNPTAPRGRVCAYLSTTTASKLDVTQLFPGANRGFVVRATAAAPGSVTVDFSWAYTAP